MTIDRAAKYITEEGLSPAARWTLGGISTLFGALTLLSSPQPMSLEVNGSKLLAIFCFFIAAACFTKGRKRQFVGSCIAACIVAVTGWYIAEQVNEGPIHSGERTEPSIINAVLCFGVFGMPALVYLFKARFGVGPRERMK